MHTFSKSFKIWTCSPHAVLLAEINVSSLYSTHPRRPGTAVVTVVVAELVADALAVDEIDVVALLVAVDV